MTSAALKKLTFTINTTILILVFVLMGFFIYAKATFLVWFSIPTALVYVLGFFLISKERFTFYVRLVYSWLTLYMGITTICLGYRFGFHLYSMSMIPVIFYSEYMAYKLNKKNVNSFWVSSVIILIYLVSTMYAATFDPVYETDNTVAAAFWAINSLTVFCFLIYYMNSLIKSVISSEEKLTKMAMCDRLTGLYNRYYMISKLEDATGNKASHFLAMADIDNFKKINDTYGHNAGDYILQEVARIMEETCKGAVISRWGGEEFLLLFSDAKGPEADLAILETLRSTIEKYDFTFEGTKILVTLTIGYALKADDVTPDQWVKTADDKLYTGKSGGKNRVVS